MRLKANKILIVPGGKLPAVKIPICERLTAVGDPPFISGRPRISDSEWIYQKHDPPA